MRLAPGSKVDRYVVEGLLGSGGMAEVYAVRHLTLGSPAALKVLTVRSDVLQRRLVREGRAQAALHHPNVVRVLDLVDVDGAPGLVMERVDGPTLAAVVQGGPLLPDRVERLARGLLLGLGEAHRFGIVHRDLKPSNVLLARGDVPRIADFGLATALADEPAAGLTRSGAALGTPAYMAPEQHEDARGVDARADLFALGVLLYELLVGATPARGQNAVESWQAMTRKAWRAPRELDPRVPAHLDAAVRWALEPDRAERPPSVAALWEAITGSPWGGPEAPAARGQVARARPSSSEDSSALPRPARALVGRSTELLAALEPLELRGGVVTLAGTGGVGKTRLAVAVAERWVSDGRDALWVELAPARHADDVVQLVALRLADAGDGSITAVGRALGRRGALLLVLDNLEQLPREVGAVLTAWTGLAPSLRVLATSREPVGLPDEVVIEVQPLPLPDDPAEVLLSPGWTLFQAMAPRAALDGVPAHRARALLQTLEGLPLAIELAAARLEVLELDELEQRLQDRFSVLTDPDAPDGRHGALWTAIAWSWSLLSDGERQALAQASVFRAPFSLEAAEAVLSPGVPVLDALHGLVRRSLLRRRGGRFTVLGSIRDFARRQLDERGWQQVVGRHARWHAAAADALFGSSAVATAAGLRRLEPLVPELDAVVANAAEVPGLAAEGLRCGRGCVSLSTTRGPREAVIRVATAALALAPDPAAVLPSQSAMLLLLRALALRRGARFDLARLDLDQALALVGDDSYGAVVAAHMGDLLSAVGDPRAAEPWHRRAVTLAEQHGPDHLVATASACLAATAWALGRPDEVPALLARARAELPPGNLTAELEVCKLEGWLALEADQLDPAEAAFTRALPVAEALANARAVAHLEGSLGLVSEVKGDLALAEARLQRAAARMAEEGDPIQFGYWEGCRGRVLLRRRQWTEGCRVLEAALLALPPTPEPELREVLVAALALGRARSGDLGRAAAHPIAATLAGGFHALARSDRETAAAAAAEVRDQLDSVRLETRTVVELVLADLCDLLATWRVAADGAWADPPGGERVELGRHAANARILAHLVRRHLAEPGRCSTVEDLAEAGWPGERILAQAAANRVRVALSALRRAGLAALVERAEGGWRLPPDLRVLTP